MIALQARNPQLPDSSRQTAQFANMMNMARQQEAAMRQASLAQQTMDINQAQEARAAALQPSALTKAEGDAGVAKIKYFMDFVKASANDIANSSTPEQAIARGERLKQQFTDPALQARIDETIGELVSDPSKFEENRKRILVRTLDTKDQFAESHSDIFDANGNLLNKVTSPIGAFSTRITPGVVTDLPSTATQAPPPRATPTAGAGASAPMRATQGVNTTPQDLRNQGMDPRNIPSGMPTSPASFTGGMGGAGAGQITPEVMSRIVDSAFETGVMAQVDFDQLLATQPPENRQAFTDAFQRANVTLQADAPSLADSGMGQQQSMGANPVQRPQAGFADFRGPTPPSRTAGLGGDMPMERTLAQYRVGDPIRGRNPSMAPTPSPVDPAILGAQEGAKTRASKNVELEMNPRIAADIKKAERAVEKRSEALVAKNEAKILVQGYDKYIETIDALLRSADRRFIVGRIEGNLHYLGSLGQNERQAELQAMFDMIKSADTLKTLVEAKQASPSGGSPVGNASNTDVQLVAKSANAVTQTGGVAKFDEGLKQLRREAYRGRQNVLEFYGDRYGDLAAEDPKFKLNVNPIANRYISSADLPKPRTPPKTSTKVDQNNPLLKSLLGAKR
jgi:hypothetical protein